MYLCGGEGVALGRVCSYAESESGRVPRVPTCSKFFDVGAAGNASDAVLSLTYERATRGEMSLSMNSAVGVCSDSLKRVPHAGAHPLNKLSVVLTNSA